MGHAKNSQSLSIFMHHIIQIKSHLLFQNHNKPKLISFFFSCFFSRTITIQTNFPFFLLLPLNLNKTLYMYLHFQITFDVSDQNQKAMSPQFNAKKEITSITTKPNNSNNNINGMLSSHLKVNKDSHFIKKSTSSTSSPPSSSSSSSSISSSHINSIATSNKPPQQHRHPVIIYTHSPRVIKTNRRDFMALVQKLTGLSHADEDEDEEEDNGGGDIGCNPPSYHQPKQELGGREVTMMMGDKEGNRKKTVMVENEENDMLSVIKEEDYCSSNNNNVGENQVNWRFNAAEPPMYEPPPPLNPYITDFSDFMCSNQPLFNYSDSLFFSQKMRTSAKFEGMEEFGNF